MRKLHKIFNYNLILACCVFCYIGINTINVGATSTTPTDYRGNLGEFADEYEVGHDLGGTLTVKSTVATLKFNSSEDIEVSGTLKINTIATLIFDQNPYRIVYEKGLSDDEWRPDSSKPSYGYPKDTEMLFDNTAGQKFRSYYEDGKERLGRSYTIRFDSNDVNDENGSTIATLVDVTYIEVPVIASIDYNRTGKYKQSATENKEQNITLTFNDSEGTSRTITTENIGFDGTLFFRHWSIYNQMLKKEQYFESSADIPKQANFTGDFGGKVTATAIWETRNFEFVKEFTKVTRTGYDFKGWLSLNQGGRLINDTNKILKVDPCVGNSNLDYSITKDYSKYVDVLQAQWQPKKYRLILDGNQPVGTKTMEMRLIAFDSPIGALPTPIISVPNTGYVFKGWYTAKIGGEPVNLLETWTYTHGMIIYAHWEKDEHIVGSDPDIDPDLGDYDYLVPESQIVRTVELSDTDKNREILANHYWNWYYKIDCPGHYLNGETYYCTAFDPEGLNIGNISFTDNKFIAGINPWSDFSYILEQDKSTNDDDVIDDEYTGIEDGTVEGPGVELLADSGDIKTRHNYDIAFHRGKDSLTLANWKNTSDPVINNTLANDILLLDRYFNGNISNLGRLDNGHYKETTTMKFRGTCLAALVKQSVDGEATCNNGGGTVEIKSGDFDESITVAYKVYRGLGSQTPNASGSIINNQNLYNNLEEKLDIGTDNKYYMSGSRVPSGLYDETSGNTEELEFEFYPYIKMRYDTLNNNGDITIDNEVYVMGEYKRKLAFSDYAEIIYEKNNGYKETPENAYGFTLQLESSQWLLDSSTDDLAVEYARDSFDYDNVLPGGATLTLSTSVNIRQFIKVKTYQVTLTPAGKEQIEKTTGTTLNIPTFDSMRTEHVNYVNTVKNGLDTMEISQWQYYNNNLTEVMNVANQWVNGDVYSNPGIMMYPGADLSGFSIDNGLNPVAKPSTASKYYFRDYTDDGDSSNDDPYGTKANRNDFDARIATVNGNGNGNEYTKYTFSVDTSGNIWAEATGNTIMARQILLTQEQDEYDLENINTVIKDINDRTLVITKLRDALEYNTGDDNGAAWVTDGDWYNEAFDGVEVYVFESVIETGLIDDNTRTQVLDPSINTESTGTGSSFKTFAINQFRTLNYVNAYGENNKYQLGEFKGNAVHMLNMEVVYMSKPFYNTNVTVQDKH